MCSLKSPKGFCSSVINRAICCFWGVSYSVLRDTSLGWPLVCFSVPYWFGLGCIRADYFQLFGLGALLVCCMSFQFFWKQFCLFIWKKKKGEIKWIGKLSWGCLTILGFSGISSTFRGTELMLFICGGNDLKHCVSE